MGFWLPHAVGLKKRTLQTYTFISAPKVDRMPANEKGTKGLGKTLFEAIGFLSFLFGSLVLLAVVFGAIGSIFKSTKPLFQFRRVKRSEDNSQSGPEGRRK